MNAFPDEATGRTWYARAVVRHLVFVLVLIGLAVWAAREYSDRQQPRYEAAADLLVSPINSGDSTFLGIDVLRETVDGDVVVTAARYATSSGVLDRVGRRIDAQDRGQLADRIDVQPRSPSNTVTIIGEGDSPEEAALLANSVAEAVVAERREQFRRDVARIVETLERDLKTLPAEEREATHQGRTLQDRLAHLRPLVGEADPTIRISARAAPPEAPVWPRPKLAMAVAGLGALLIGMAVAIAFDLAHPSVRREDDITRDYSLPVLGHVPPLRTASLRSYLAGERALPASAVDAFRRLRAVLAASREDGRLPETVLVTGPTGDEERTPVAVALASSVALAGFRVILVDADLRRARLSSALATHRSGPGVAALFCEHGDFNNLLVHEIPRHHGRFGVVVSTPDDQTAVDSLSPEAVREAIAKLREHADVVIFIGPPPTEGGEAIAVAKHAAVVVTARMNRVHRKAVRELRDVFGAARVVPAGFVVVRRLRARLPAISAPPYAEKAGVTPERTRHGHERRSDEPELVPRRARVSRDP